MKYVPAIGNASAQLMIIGEAPSYQETERPFVGPSGKELDRILRDANIRRDDCWISNVCKYFVTPTEKIPFWIRAEQEGIDKDEQIKEGAKRAAQATGKKIDLVMFCGHGMSTRTNFGYTRRAETLSKPDPAYLAEVKRKNADYVRKITEGPFQPWEIKNMSNGKVKDNNDDAFLDTGDTDIMGSIAQYLNEKAVAVFASCSVASEYGNASLARTMSNNAKVKTFG